MHKGIPITRIQIQIFMGLVGETLKHTSLRAAQFLQFLRNFSKSSR